MLESLETLTLYKLQQEGDSTDNIRRIRAIKATIARRRQMAAKQSTLGTY